MHPLHDRWVRFDTKWENGLYSVDSFAICVHRGFTVLVLRRFAQTSEMLEGSLELLYNLGIPFLRFGERT